VLSKARAACGPYSAALRTGAPWCYHGDTTRERAPMSTTTTLKLPSELKRRIARLVDGTERSAHAFMLEAIAHQIEHEERLRAVEALAEHRLVGRRVQGELRELVISFGRTGYVALYRFVPARNQVRILAIRHQRELGYPR